MVVLITGGAGYIGSHTVHRLAEKGFDVVIYDNLSRGHMEAVKGFPLVVGDIGDRTKVAETIQKYHVQAVMHFAAESQVGESMVNPAKYFENNVAKSILFLNEVINRGVKHFVFSSSAAVYGEPISLPIKESHMLNPTNPYGDTKLQIEKVLERYHQTYGLRYVSLRYFNAAGADPTGKIGEDHNPETHLIPLALQVALKQKKELHIYGGDYPTPDRTAVRDFVHVVDLAEGHILALQALREGMNKGIYNMGNERGYSVLEVVESAKRISRCEIKYRVSPPRPGDPAVLVADCEKIRRELGWRPLFPQLDEIMKSAWDWHKTHLQGFSK
ncbi:MAG: UDP-glucose 4-epimerase GalE [Bacillota bacterium]|jgi:UDP-glucose 4-epimerase